jgi:hypothetical protein
MSGQRGAAGNVAIPTLAFSRLAAMIGEIKRRGLGTNNLNAVRVQPYTQRIGDSTCYSVSVTAFDDVQGCILAGLMSYGCFSENTPRPELVTWAKTAHVRLTDSLHEEWGFVVALGQWVHDPIPPYMVIDMLGNLLQEEQAEPGLMAEIERWHREQA